MASVGSSGPAFSPDAHHGGDDPTRRRAPANELPGLPVSRIESPQKQGAELEEILTRNASLDETL
jgi:hypothetical protein